ncbi:hypothetical protein ABBQ38_003180 [Trebouxia sp. C0009 RCD-2024]
MRRITSNIRLKAWTSYTLPLFFHTTAYKAEVHTQAADRKRRHTAHQVLKLIEGNHLDKQAREQQMLDAIHFTDPGPAIPSRWFELARRVQKSGPEAVRQAFSQHLYAVPDIEKSTECRCTLTAHSTARRFLYPQLNKFLADLFEAIPAAVDVCQLPEVQLNRFDLFHGHLFCTRNSQQLGLLFHAKEYPAFSKDTFPINLGYCQQNSKLVYDQRAMDFRNMLWFQGRLCCLDVGPDSTLHHDLIMDGLQDVRTILESDFGESVIDVNYFASLPFLPQQKLFLC